MTLKIISALIACILAVSPVLGQTSEQPIGVLESNAVQPDPGQVIEQGHPYAISPSPWPFGVYTPAWTDRWWVDAGFLMGFVQPGHLPPLATTSPPGTPQALAGVLGPNTNILFGDRDVDGDMRLRFSHRRGAWFNDDRTLGFEMGFFWLTGLDQSFAASSNGSTILARPFTDAATGVPASLLVAFPKGSGPAGASAAGAWPYRRVRAPSSERTLTLRRASSTIQDFA